MMTLKDRIVQELEQMPESSLEEVLEFIRALKKQSSLLPEENRKQSDVWQAYLASKQEREEVYRRLANS